MRTSRLARSIPFAALTAVCLAAPVSAQVAIPRWPGGSNGPTYNQGSYDSGYREGLEHGREDARANRSFDYGRHREYRDASRGWGSGNEFRRGFEDGYRQGYERNRGSLRNGGYESGRYGPYGDSGRYGGYDNGRYPDDRYGYGYGVYGAGRQAFDRGFEDGLKKGREDGRDGDRFDPTRHKDYRKATDGYNKNYGSKDAYQSTYRDGFRTGYDRGYRENARGWSGYRR